MIEGGIAAALVSAGIICLIAAVIGGGLKGLGFELPALQSMQRQILLGGLGAVLLAVGLVAPIQSRKSPDAAGTPSPSPTPASSPAAPSPVPIERPEPATGAMDGFCDVATREAQGLLGQLGYYRGVLDGCGGPVTRAALERFQKEEGLINSARADQPTLAALRRRANRR